MRNFVKLPEVHTIVLTDKNDSIAYRENVEADWSNIRDHPMLTERAIDQIDTAIFKKWFGQFNSSLSLGKALVVCGTSVVRDFPRLSQYSRAVTDAQSGEITLIRPKRSKEENEPDINKVINPKNLLNQVYAFCIQYKIEKIIVLGGVSVYEQFSGYYDSITRVHASIDIGDTGCQTKKLYDGLLLNELDGYSRIERQFEMFNGCEIEYSKVLRD